MQQIKPKDVLAAKMNLFLCFVQQKPQRLVLDAIFSSLCARTFKLELVMCRETRFGEIGFGTCRLLGHTIILEFLMCQVSIYIEFVILLVY